MPCSMITNERAHSRTQCHTQQSTGAVDKTAGQLFFFTQGVRSGTIRNRPSQEERPMLAMTTNPERHPQIITQRSGQKITTHIFGSVRRISLKSSSWPAKRPDGAHHAACKNDGWIGLDSFGLHHVEGTDNSHQQKSQAAASATVKGIPPDWRQ